MAQIDFNRAFAALTGNDPFPWQRELYKRFVSDRKDNIPASCNLPTGLGKTSVIAVWLIALANGCPVPRRLVYVVNRRTVVDQTTTEVVRYRRKLAGEEVEAENVATVSDLAERLRALAALPGGPLAISTLRGQFADNREWSADPARPAVICGTVDMIGSRLLFSGYGCGFKTRPLHAGFLGQDALIVHDEAHLEPAFQKLLIEIEKEQQRCKDFRPLRVMELTATSRGDGPPPFTLSDEDYKDATVQERVGAKKALHLHPNKDEKKLAEEIADLALTYKDTGRAILVFVRKVDDVEKIVAKLKKEKQKDVQQLTGTLRGRERDDLVSDPVFVRFLPKAVPDGKTVYLVCTSAGEVGVNISADHLVCDLSTFESMAQRFGRVNRFGKHPETKIHVVHPKEADFDGDSPIDVRRMRTLALLVQLNGAGSPAAFGKLDPKARQEAFAPTPTILPVSDILFDAWALTTIRAKLPGRPAVEPYLHGLAEWQPPETHVAWREEVGRITGALLTQYPPQDLLEDYPLKPHELLRDNSGRVFDRLKKLKAGAETPVWVVDDDDSVRVTTLGELIDAGKEAIERRTVLLPPEAGGLANGMLDATSNSADDVSDRWFTDESRTQCRRIRVWDDDTVPSGMRRIRKAIDIKPDAEEAEEEETGTRFWYWFELSSGGDGDGSKNTTGAVLWQVHTDDVVKNTVAIIEKLGLGELMKAFEIAAKCHDLGKRRKVFQAVLGNRDPNVWLAKSGAKGGRIAEAYRHEFGSLIDTANPDLAPGFADLSEDLKAFVLHVIAAHHGRGRPHFPEPEAFDPERSDRSARTVAREVPQRFARLQRRYGRWGLAYLESLLRAADYAASAKPPAVVTEGGK